MSDLYRIDRSDCNHGISVTSSLTDTGHCAECGALLEWLVPVVLDPVTQWCFAHQDEVFTHLDGSEVCARYMRSPCDVADAAVIRIGDET